MTILLLYRSLSPPSFVSAVTGNHYLDFFSTGIYCANLCKQKVLEYTMTALVADFPMNKTGNCL